MKKTEEYFKELRFNADHHLGLGDVRLTIAQQEELVKQVQLDAIEETVKLCAENARMGNTENGIYTVFEVSKQSILDCAEILKKELE